MRLGREKFIPTGPREGHHMPCKSSGEHKVLVRWRKTGMRGKPEPSFHWRFIGKARHSRVRSLGLASWNNFSRLWALGVVSSCLVPGPGMIRTEEILVCVFKLDKEVAGSVDVGLVALPWLMEPFAISKNWLTLGRVVSPSQQVF